MTTCPDCFASLLPSEAAQHKHRFHNSVPIFACGDCHLMTPVFTHAVVHALLHGHSSELRFQAKSAREKFRMSTANDDRPLFTDQSLPPVQSKPDLFESREETFDELEETTVTEPSSLDLFSVEEVETKRQSGVMSASAAEPILTTTEPSQSYEESGTRMTNEQIDEERSQTYPSKNTFSSFPNEGPTCSQCSKTVCVKKGFTSSLLQKSVQHVIHCARITPYACTGCSATFGRRGCVERHARRRSRCKTAKAAMPNILEDEKRIRNGLKLCFPTLDIAWTGLR